MPISRVSRLLTRNWGILCSSFVLEAAAILHVFAAPGLSSSSNVIFYVLLWLLGASQVPAMLVMSLLVGATIVNASRSWQGWLLLFGTFFTIGFLTIVACLTLFRILVRWLLNAAVGPWQARHQS